MCISIVFCIKPTPETDYTELKSSIGEQIMAKGFGGRPGSEALIEPVRNCLVERFPEYVFFEVHDEGEHHCACDIDQDIRNCSKTGARSPFFHLVDEVRRMKGVGNFSVFFADNDAIEGKEVTILTGTFGDFFDRLNRWHTWQTEGYEPTRNAFFIADDAPLLFNLTKTPTN